ncbi:MAG: hypothetical protein Q8P54_01045 [bacterium]|nr:hypothetical protein [bacterium]
MDPNQNPMPNVPTAGMQAKRPVDLLKRNKLLKIIIIVLLVLILIMLGISIWFGYRAFINQKDLDSKYQAGVSDGRSIQKSEDRALAKKETENPYRTYKAPNAYGGFEVSFPKNWSLTIDSTTTDPIIAYAHPDDVDIKSDKFALRFILENAQFAVTKIKFDKQTKEAKRNFTAAATKVSGIDAVRYTGILESKTNDPKETKKIGTVVIVPVRDKTLIFQTDSNENYLNYFNEILSRVKIFP